MNLKDKLIHFDSSRLPDCPPEESGPETESGAVPEHWLRLAHITNSELVGESSFYYYKKYVADIEDFDELLELAGHDWELSHLHELEPNLKNKNHKLTDFLFFDLETTSISGGSGTVAFLIGTAYVFMNQVIVEQLVLPEFSCEHLQLSHFQKMVRQHPAIASFNGKSFDVPIISNRFILNQMVPELEDKFHLDVLYPARRLWAARLGSYRLQNLEEHILGEARVEDVPGELIPGVYFRFSYGEGLDEFRRVLQHNYLDLLNLVRITAVLENTIRNPMAMAEPQDLSHYLKFCEKSASGDRIIELMLKTDLSAIPTNALHPGARLLKRAGHYTKAAEFFEKLIEQNIMTDSIIREYTILLERYMKDYNRAADLLSKKINRSRIRSMLNTGLNSELPSEWTKRLERIKKKQTVAM